MTTWEYASSKLGNISNKAVKVAKEVFDAAQAAGHDIWFMWGNGSEPDHVYNQQGQPVLDFMVRSSSAGDWVRNYIWFHRARLGLKHVIWNQRITSTVIRPGVVRKMSDRGNDTANHRDHVHGHWFAGPYTPLVVAEPARKTNEQLAAEVWRGDWGNGADRRRRLREAGYDPDAVQRLVNQGVGKPRRKSISELATEVIRGDWGNGEERKRRLREAGYDYTRVQAEVNRRVR